MAIKQTFIIKLTISIMLFAYLNAFEHASLKNRAPECCLKS